MSKKNNIAPGCAGIRSDGSIWMAFGNPNEGYHEQFDFYGSERLANHIVTVVNSHDDLVEALKGLLSANEAVQLVLCNGPEVPGFDPTELGKAQQRVTEAEDKARAALSKAGVTS